MEKLINALLTDENGISEEAYNALVEYLEFMEYAKDRFTVADMMLATKCRKMLRQADATDGRFYIPKMEPQ